MTRREDLADGLQRSINAALQRRHLPPTAFSMSLESVDMQRWSMVAGAVAPSPSAAGQRFTWQTDRLVNPASLLKLLTTAVAFDELGPGFRAYTEFYRVPQVDQTRPALWVRGGGDPGFRAEQLYAALVQLQARGMAWPGELVLDRSYFLHSPFLRPVEPIDPAGYRAYHARPDALLLNHSALAVQLQGQEGRKPMVESRLAVPLPGFTVNNQLKPQSSVCTPWKDGLNVQWLSTRSSPPMVNILLAGDFPVRCGTTELILRVQTPNLFWSAWVSMLWPMVERWGERDANQRFSVEDWNKWSALPRNPQLGGKLLRTRSVAGAAVLPNDARLLLIYPGSSLVELVKDVNKFSNNVMADSLAAQVLLRAGHEDWGRVVRAWLQAQSIGSDDVVIDSGSGLSRETRLSTRHLTQLLQQVVHKPWFAAYLDSLPVAGVDGTLKRRLARHAGAAAVAVGRPDGGSAAQQNAWLKTGRLNDVAGLAGYVLASSGQVYALALTLNTPGAPEHAGMLDELVQQVQAVG